MRYPRPARDASLKCIPCNAPLTETTNGRFVCVECGESRIERRAKRSCLAERDGIRVRKILEAVDDDTVEVRYSIESERDDGVGVKVSDRLPSGEPARGDGSKAVDADGGWEVGDTNITYACHVEGGESITSGLNVVGPRSLLHEEASELRIESITPTTRGVSIQSTEADELSRTDDPTHELDGSRVGDGQTVQDAPAGDGISAESREDSRVRSNGDGRVSRLERREPPRSSRSGAVRMAEPASLEPRGTLHDEDQTTTVLAGIPAYNESRTIADVVDRAQEYADEVVVVDDGSDDSTASTASDAGATVVEHKRNRGYGASLKTLFFEAFRRDADCLVVLDGDGQHDPAEIPK